jgi:hypothetical protein
MESLWEKNCYKDKESLSTLTKFKIIKVESFYETLKKMYPKIFLFDF